MLIHRLTILLLIVGCDLLEKEDVLKPVDKQRNKNKEE